MIVKEGPFAKKSKPAPRMDFLLAGSWRNTANKNADNRTNPLQWWKENASHFPAISKVAQKCVTIPGTSFLLERVYLTAGNIVRHKRSCLLSDNVNMLNFFEQKC